MKGWLTKFGPLAAVILTLAFCVSVLFLYVPKTLEGDFNKYFLASDMFGVPAELRAHGITPLYHAPIPGWDGQFYYYMSNDILAQKDTSQHLDSPAYRYQRIGLPLLANLASRLTLQSWVSPATYYLTSLILILFATFMAARFFQSKGVNPLWSLVWALGFGTQITLLNGLTDAAADALLIIALVSLLEGRRWLYLVAVSFAVLAREVYVLVPASIAAVQFYAVIQPYWKNAPRVPVRILIDIYRAVIWHLPAILAFVAWRVYLKIHFGVSPSSEAYGVLGLPFVATYHYLLTGFSSYNQSFSLALIHVEPVILLFYTVFLVVGLYFIASALREILVKLIKTDGGALERLDATLVGIYLAFAAIGVLYTAFGPTVMMDHTGYLKAENILLFIVPFVAVNRRKAMSFGLKLWLVVFTVLISIPTLRDRINASPQYGAYTTPKNIEYAKSAPACVSHPSARLELLPLEPKSVIKDSIFTRVMHARVVVYQLQVQNTSDETYYPYQGKGSMNISYRWLDSSDHVVKEGIQTWLTGPLAPGATVVRPVVVAFPTKPGDYVLKFSLVQEGCFWLYDRQPSSSYSMHFQIR